MGFNQNECIEHLCNYWECGSLIFWIAGDLYSSEKKSANRLKCADDLVLVYWKSIHDDLQSL